MALMSRIIIVSIIMLAVGFVSCKKEYVDKINTIPGDTTHISGMNYIKTFEIKEYSADTVIKASITADTVIVYWPSYSRALPDSIAPVIALPDSASISPASGKKVAFKTGTIYTVTSAAGTVKKYILKVSQLSAVPWFSFGSPGLTLGEYISLSGDQFWQDTSQTKVYFVSATTKTAYQAELFLVGIGGPRFIIPLNIPPNELYDIKVVNGPYTIYNALEARRNAVNLVYPTVATLNAAGLPSKLARGTRFTVRGVLLQNAQSASLYAGGAYTPIELVSSAIDRVVLKVPAGMATGVYTRVRVITSDGLSKFITGISITISE